MIELPTLESLNVVVTLPALSLVLGAIVLLLVDVFLPERRRWITGWLALIGVLVSLGITLLTADRTGEAFGGMFVADQFTAFLNVVVLITAAVGILIAMDYLRRTDMNRSEYYFLLLFSTSGMMFMARPTT
jgi:NADH-quinone oxidoreductase subunit N